MAEEKQHEKLCLHDIKALGFTIDELPEHASTRMFYETQYYKVEHKHPAALLGYILPLEAIAVSRGRELLSMIQGTYEERAISFIKLHAEEDPDHLEKALTAIESLPAELHAMVIENLEQTTHAYLGMLAEIRQKSS
jgi:pyrroloquinoline quinone (PQQ) biosynthesis protein C